MDIRCRKTQCIYNNKYTCTAKEIKINKEVVDPDDVEMLEDLVCSAVNDCLGQISRKEKESMPSLPGM